MKIILSTSFDTVFDTILSIIINYIYWKKKTQSVLLSGDIVDDKEFKHKARGDIDSGHSDNVIID